MQETDKLNGWNITPELVIPKENPNTIETQIQTKDHIWNVLGNLSFDIAFSMNDDLIWFTDKIENLSNSLNKIDFINISDEILTKLKPIIQSLFTYLTVKKDEILDLDKNILNWLKTYYREIQKKIDSIKINDSSKKSIYKILNCIIDLLKKWYYLFIPPEKNKKLPNKLKTDDTLVFFKDNNRFDNEDKFNQILAKTEKVCDQILENTDIILSLDLDQLEELKSGINNLISEVDLAISDQKYIDKDQKLKLESLHKKLQYDTLVEIDSQINIKNFTIKTQKIYTKIPDLNPDELAVNSELFWFFLNKIIRELKRIIIKTKDILLKLEKYDLIILKNLLIEIKNKLDYILKLHSYNTSSLIPYNANFSLNFINSTLEQIQI